MLKTVLASTAAILLAVAPASALTLTNNSSKEHMVGIDMGAKEEVKSVGAGKSVTIEGCNDGCGLTGPWGYSKWAKTGDKLAFDGKSKIAQ